MEKNRVLVRTYSAGVHVGELVSREGREVRLADARRIWRWRGANTLHEVSLRGVESAAETDYTRVSDPVEWIELTEAIEVLPVTPEAWDRICSAGWAR